MSQRLAPRHHANSDGNLIGKLAPLPGTSRPEERDRLAQAIEHRPGPRKDCGVTAGHDHERRVSRSHVATGDRRVNRGETAGRGRRCNPCRKRRARCRHVDQERSWTGTIEQAGHLRRRFGIAPTEIDILHVRRQTEHRDHHVTGRGDASGIVMPHGTGCEERLGLLASAAEDVQLMPSRKQVAGHAAAHDASADEANARQRRSHDGGKVVWHGHHPRRERPQRPAGLASCPP